MKTYNIVTPHITYGGLPDESRPWMVISTGLTAEEANNALFRMIFTCGYVEAEDPETGKRYHCNTRGLMPKN